MLLRLNPSSSLISRTFMAMGLISTSLFVAWSVFAIGGGHALSLPRYGSGQSERGEGGNPEGGNRDLQDILRKAHQGPLYDYPTSFTQEIMPRPIHSHNDYWRPVPFYTALSYGAISIEADVWLVNDTLLVGHHASSLTSTRTFQSLYLDPILDVLERQNPSSAYAKGTKNGVWDTAPDQTLYLFVDVKTEGESTWKKVLEEIEVLHKKNYLSTATSSTFTSRAITIIGTGATPLHLITSVTPRHYFYDGPLQNLTDFTGLISPIASTDFYESFGAVKSPNGLDEKQIGVLRNQVKGAHEKGIAVRYWNQPDWPIRVRDRIWEQLVEEGVDLLNVDDLRAGSGVGRWCLSGKERVGVRLRGRRWLY